MNNAPLRNVIQWNISAIRTMCIDHRRVMAMSLYFGLRVLIWAGCLVGFLYQTSSMLSLFFEYPFSVTLVEDVRKNILFPAATVCLHRWLVACHSN